MLPNVDNFQNIVNNFIYRVLFCKKAFFDCIVRHYLYAKSDVDFFRRNKPDKIRTVLYLTKMAKNQN